MLLLVLTSVLGYQLKIAVGTSVFIMSFTALTGAVAHIVHGGTDLKALVLCSICALISSKGAAKFSNKTDNKKLNKNVETKNNKHAPTAFSHLPLNNSLAFSLHSTLSVTK